MKTIAIAVLVIMLAMPLASATVEYTTTTRTVCESGICTKTLYGGTRYIQEDSVWKPIEKARSLLGYYDAVYLESDKDFELTVVDFNYSSITVDAKFTGDWMEYAGECTLRELSVQADCDFKLNVMINDTDVKEENILKIDTANADTATRITIASTIGELIKFGGNSTTVQLQDADSEVLEDTYVTSQYYPDRSYGAARRIRANDDATSVTVSYVKFDLTDLPSVTEHTSILSSTIAFYAFFGNEECGTLNFTIFQVSNQTWVEGNGSYSDGQECPGCEGGITWNSRPSTATLIDYNDTYTNLTYEDKWITFDVQSWVSNQYEADNDNVSFMLNVTAVSPCSNAGLIDMYSKETVTAYPPYLNVTYETSSPFLRDVELNDSTVYANESLNCSATYSSNVSSGMIEFIWYNDGVIQNLNGSQMNLNEGNTASTNVTAAPLSPGEVWICSARAYNTTHYGSWTNSSSVTIYQHPQWQNNVSSFPSNYSTDNTSEVNITINTSSGSISSVEIYNNFDGSYGWNTMTNSYGGDIYNYSMIIGAGSGTYKIRATDGNSEINVTDTWSWSISKADNNCHINITKDGANSTDSDVSANSDDTLIIRSYCDGGTPLLHVDGASYSNPDSRTWGVGTYTILSNTSGNANYTSNATGISITLTIVEGVSGAGGGGGGSSLTIVPVGADFTVYPSGRIELFSAEGTRPPMVTIYVYNGNTSQNFGLGFSDELRSYCRLDEYEAGITPPFAQTLFGFSCLAPDEVTEGNVYITTTTGGKLGIPLTIGPSIGFFAQFGDFLRLMASGDWDGFLIAYHGVPMAVIVVLISIAFIVLWRM